jgi:hypothetical protein
VALEPVRRILAGIIPIALLSSRGLLNLFDHSLLKRAGREDFSLAYIDEAGEKECRR